MAVELPDSKVPDIKLIHFERSRVIEPDSQPQLGRVDEQIEYEGLLLQNITCM